MDTNNASSLSAEEWLNILREQGGYYRCPKESGKRLGPLVGYAGTYDGPDGKKLQYVGDEFANFARIEYAGALLRRAARQLLALISTKGYSHYRAGFVGMPMGGLNLATGLAMISGNENIYPEIIVDELKTATSRQKTHMEFSRHAPSGGQNYIIVEDVCNNFSTTSSAIDLIESHHAEVIGIACFLNRSPLYKGTYPHKGRNIPILALVEREIPEYRQDDPAVAEDVASGNVIWKPKAQWPELMKAMSVAA